MDNQSINNTYQPNMDNQNINNTYQPNMDNQNINNTYQPNMDSKKKNFINKFKEKKYIFLIIFAVIILIISLLIFLMNKNDNYDNYYADSNYYISDTPYVIENSQQNFNSNSSTHSTQSDSTTKTTTVQNNTTTYNNTTTKKTTTYNNTTTQSTSKNYVDRTVLIYIVGSDLESENGAATQDIQEMIDAKVDSNTKVYIYTGGSNSWKNDIISSYNNEIYEINNQGIIKVAQFDSLNMGDPNTLSSFINYVYNISHTSKYDLILWDHGGGPIAGYGNDEKTKDVLELNEIKFALNNTKFNTNNKLEFIGFDACLMSNVETAYSLKDYAEYLLASEELEPGFGWNYKALSNVSELNTKDFAKKIIDEYVTAMKEAEEYYNYYGNSLSYTLSLIDLDRIEALTKQINNSFKLLESKLDSEYEQIAKIRASSVEFGKSQSQQSYDLIDLHSFIENANGYNLEDLKKVLKEVIVYSKSNIRGANGIAIYFPYTNTYLAKLFLSYYSNFSEFQNYQSFINSFYDIQSGTKRNDISLESATFKRGKIELNLSKKQIENISRANYIIFEKSGEYYIPIYKSSKFAVSGNKLIANYDNKQLVVKDKDGYSSLNLIYIRNTNKGDLYYAPVNLTNTSNEDMNKWIIKNGYIQLYIKDNKVIEQGIVPLNNDIISNNTSKIKWSVKDWTSIAFTNFRYNILDKNGNYTMNWIPDKTKYLYEIKPQEEKFSFEFRKLNSNKEYYAVVNVLDYQGNIYNSELFKIK